MNETFGRQEEVWDKENRPKKSGTGDNSEMELWLPVTPKVSAAWEHAKVAFRSAKGRLFRSETDNGSATHASTFRVTAIANLRRVGTNLEL